MLDDQDRAQIWEQAIGAAARATRQVTAAAFTDPAAAGDAAWAAADFLTAAARVVEGRRRGPLTAAADEYDRAAREIFGRHPQPRHAGHELRRASRLLLTARAFTHRDTGQLLELLARMIAFTEAVARLRETQHRAAQAAAARRAAEQLQHCRHIYAGPAAPNGIAAADTPRRRHTATAAPRHGTDVNGAAGSSPITAARPRSDRPCSQPSRINRVRHPDASHVVARRTAAEPRRPAVAPAAATSRRKSSATALGRRPLP